MRKKVRRSEHPLLDLTNNSALAFTLTLNDGKIIETVGEAADYFATLTPEQRDLSHWKIAIRMLNNALKEPNYLKTATMSLQSALVLDGILATPGPLQTH
jgi:hypothetical protein